MINPIKDITIGELFGSIVVAVTVISGFIQFSPIKINPWTWLAKKIGSAVNEDVFKELDALHQNIEGVKNDFEKLQDAFDERNAVECRRVILRFSDEILHGVLHSKEHYNEVLNCATEYDQFCLAHPDFKNHLTVSAINIITAKYTSHMQNNDFLQ